MHRASILTVALAIATLQSAVADLTPGSPAPKLEIKKWIKGTPLTELPKGVSVVEFWATWCGPCLESIPHLTKLAKQYSSVTMLGVSISEEDKNDSIKNFVSKMGPKMDYLVAYSGMEGGMSASWMDAAHQNGIPTAFIVKDGVIQWIGSPFVMDEPLANVVSGKFNVDDAKKEFLSVGDVDKNKEELVQVLRDAQDLYDKGSPKAAHRKLDALDVKYPAFKDETAAVRDIWDARDKPDEFVASTKEIFGGILKNDSRRRDREGAIMRLAMDEKTRKFAKRPLVAMLGGHDLGPDEYYVAVYVYQTLGDFPSRQKIAKLALAYLKSHKEPAQDAEEELFTRAAKTGSMEP